ncbi:uncharacterized protein [Argopecten irradians]|uniref:uncharacterized protein n=1 Tax=Argopecten irradians TaxID=31199 RepID=UPI003722E3E8
MATSKPLLDGQGDKTIQESLDALFLSDTDCDVTFIVGDQRTRISAHKLILACRNPAFSLMFENCRRTGKRDEIVIMDITADIFYLFLRYLYTDEIQLNKDTATALLSVTKKFRIDCLTSKCNEYLLGRMCSKHESMESILVSDSECDVTFIVGDQRTRMYAHKQILTYRSPVFSVMFEGPLAEKDEVVIPDIPADILCLFLRYLYTDIIQLNLDNAAPLLDVARKYWIDILVEECELYLLDQASFTNARAILEQAIIFVIDSVREKCLEIIDQKFSRDRVMPSMESESYPNISTVFGRYSGLVGREKGKYWALRSWLIMEKHLNSEKVKPTGRDVTDKNKSLIECLGELFESGTMSDVVFIVGAHKERIHAHRLILISRSPVFYAMFEGESAGELKIILPDTSESAFYSFIRYLYTDKIRCRPCDADHLCDLARKYNVDSYFKDMTVYNVCRKLFGHQQSTNNDNPGRPVNIGTFVRFRVAK